MNKLAQHFLDTYDNGHEVEGGWKFAKALQQAKLDYSEAGLNRLNQLLTAIRVRAQPTLEEMQESLQGRNFCSLIAYHLIETVRRRTGAYLEWHERASALQALPADVPLPDALFARLVLLAPDQGAAFMPLGWIEAFLFSEKLPLSASEYVASLGAQIEANGPVVWSSGMEALGQMASWQMMMAADGGSVNPMMLRSNAPKAWVILMPDSGGDREALQMGARSLEDNPEGSIWQVLSYDGIANLKSVRCDAVMVVLQTYGAPSLFLKIAFPYRPAVAGRSFEIHTPAVLETNMEDARIMKLMGAMERGIQSIKWAFGTTWNQLRKG